MEILDEEGRLFGRVNIVDALVVLFAVAVVVAGAALVFGDSPEAQPGPDSGQQPENATLYVTLYANGDETTGFESGEVQLDGASANITDVHRTIGPRSYFRVALNGTETDEGFRFDGNRVRRGGGFTLTDNTTRTNARVVERDVGPGFDTRTTTVAVETTVRTQVAEAVSEGDEQRVGDEAILTVASVEAAPVNETHSDLRATLELETRVVDGVPHYGDRPVRLGRELGVRTDDYEFEADVVARE